MLAATYLKIHSPIQSSTSVPSPLLVFPVYSQCSQCSPSVLLVYCQFSQCTPSVPSVLLVFPVYSQCSQSTASVPNVLLMFPVYSQRSQFTPSVPSALLVFPFVSIPVHVGAVCDKFYVMNKIFHPFHILLHILCDMINLETTILYMYGIFNLIVVL